MLARGASWLGCHKPRWQRIKTVMLHWHSPPPALYFTLAILGCLLFPSGHKFLSPSTFIRADPTVKNTLFVFPGQSFLLLRFRLSHHLLSERCPGCPHHSAWSAVPLLATAQTHTLPPLRALIAAL